MEHAESSTLRPVSLDDKYTHDHSSAYMTGIEALVRLGMLQKKRDLKRGLNTAGFVSGYRGSPLGGVDQAMWAATDYLNAHDITFQPGINEDIAATAVWGSQQTNLFDGARFDGVFGMWYGKGPGVDRSMDVIKHANAFGTSRFGGVLAVAGDDHACKSSTLPHQSEHMFIGASVPVLAPANVQEVLDLGIFGWELSRYSGCWVGLKAITENMDSAISADIDSDRIQIVIPNEFDLPGDGVNARWPDKPLAQELRLNKYKIYAAREFARVNKLNRVVRDSPSARLGIITSGKAYLDVLQALEDIGITESVGAEIGIRVFKVGMPWPLEPRSTHEFAEGLEEILVVEEKRSVIEDQLTSQLYNYPVGSRPIVLGEFDETGRDLLPNIGELTPAMIALVLASRIRRFFSSDLIEARVGWIEAKEKSLAVPHETIERMPHFCSGCPHNSSTKVPEGSHALGGIGCHYMATWMPDRPTHTFTQMGGEGATWIGQAPFTTTSHVFQNLGDGTYFHSGVLAIRASVAAGVNITYKILFNDAVAMTGGQPLDGSLTIDALVYQLRGEGVRRVALVSDNPKEFAGMFWDVPGYSLTHRDDYEALMTELRKFKGTSVIIYQQMCAAEKRRRIKKGTLTGISRRVVINEDVCEGCGDCGTASNCLSIIPTSTPLGTKREIDQSACNHDFSCLKGFCPSFVSVIGGEMKKPDLLSSEEPLFDPLPEPVLPNLNHTWNTVVAGVGGSGVLTVTSLIAMAAHIEGKGCATLNQTGLAQKFGAVISHVRVACSQEEINTVRIPAGEADLFIGCDLVVSAGYEAMGKAAHGRTHAIVNDYQQPTAEFIRNPNTLFPAASMRDKISREIGGNLEFVHATDIAMQLTGNKISTNLFLLGYAWQRGWVPVGREALERAIDLNAVAVDSNKTAFLLGRRYAHQPTAVNSMLSCQSEEAESVLTLDELIEDRTRRLVSYQSCNYAKKYLDQINTIRIIDPRADDSGSLTHTVATQLFKLMAYKDEYEVARLLSNDIFRSKLTAQFGGNYSLRFHLAPPILNRKDPVTGKLNKREFGPWLMPLFRILAKLKWLRGTPFDLFALTAERKFELEDLARYQRDLTEICERLTTENYDATVALANLPATLRGFGHIKQKNRGELLDQRSALLARLRGVVQCEDISFTGAS